jgi:hypothetical protein
MVHASAITWFIYINLKYLIYERLQSSEQIKANTCISYKKELQCIRSRQPKVFNYLG